MEDVTRSSEGWMDVGLTVSVGRFVCMKLFGECITASKDFSADAERNYPN